MRKIYYTLDIGYAGCGDEGLHEVDDDATDKEIDQLVDDLAMDWASTWEGDDRLGEDWDEEGTEAYYQQVSGSWRWATADDE